MQSAYSQLVRVKAIAWDALPESYPCVWAPPFMPYKGRYHAQERAGDRGRTSLHS